MDGPHHSGSITHDLVEISELVLDTRYLTMNIFNIDKISVLFSGVDRGDITVGKVGELCLKLESPSAQRGRGLGVAGFGFLVSPLWPI